MALPPPRRPLGRAAPPAPHGRPPRTASASRAASGLGLVQGALRSTYTCALPRPWHAGKGAALALCSSGAV